LKASSLPVAGSDLRSLDRVAAEGCEQFEDALEVQNLIGPTALLGSLQQVYGLRTQQSDDRCTPCRLSPHQPHAGSFDDGDSSAAPLRLPSQEIHGLAHLCVESRLAFIEEVPDEHRQRANQGQQGDNHVGAQRATPKAAADEARGAG
jgi:hypothetical protein